MGESGAGTQEGRGSARRALLPEIISSSMCDMSGRTEILTFLLLVAGIFVLVFLGFGKLGLLVSLGVVLTAVVVFVITTRIERKRGRRRS
jgi:phosphatidylglycerophosphate synthase